MPGPGFDPRGRGRARRAAQVANALLGGGLSGLGGTIQVAGLVPGVENAVLMSDPVSVVVDFDTPGLSYWTAPITGNVLVECFGPGGNATEHGGGGGEYAKSTVAVVEGTEYPIFVGEPSLGFIYSSFNTTTVVANGGGNATELAVGAGGTGGTGTTLNAGGAGALGVGPTGVSFNTSGRGTLTVSAGVTLIHFQAWMKAGAGGSDGNNGSGAGGGGGGSGYAEGDWTVTPGDILTWDTDAGTITTSATVTSVTLGSPYGYDGWNGTIFAAGGIPVVTNSGDIANLITKNGGNGECAGAPSGGGGAGGTLGNGMAGSGGLGGAGSGLGGNGGASTVVGSEPGGGGGIDAAGANGWMRFTWSFDDNGGGGGGSSGTATGVGVAGAAGSGGTGGAGGTAADTNGGDGGDGGTSANGEDGHIPGGGGGGRSASSTVAGKGARGRVRITYSSTEMQAAWESFAGFPPSFANPTATIGLNAVNGSATTYMRSDAAPPLSQAIVPNWTGKHSFGQGTTVFGAGNLTASPVASTIQGADGAGTNIAGVALTIRGSLATGNATPGTILVKVGVAGSSGTTLQTATTLITIAQGGATVVPTTDAGNGIIIQQFSGTQSGDLLQAKTSSGTVRFRVLPTGVATDYGPGGVTTNAVYGGGAGSLLTSGARNLYFGNAAGSNTTTGSDNVALGASAGPGTSGLSNTTTIGGNSTTESTNTVAIGKSLAVDNASANLIVIGVSAPVASSPYSIVMDTSAGSGDVFGTNTINIGYALGNYGAYTCLFGTSHDNFSAYVNCVMLGHYATTDMDGEIRYSANDSTAARLGLTMKSSSTKDRKALSIDVSWATSTDASRASIVDFSAYYITTAQRGIRLEANSGGIKIGFFTTTPVAQQTCGAFTNNVTSGGTTDQVANYTDLVVYANDAAAIRNDLYQLALKVQQLTAIIRAFGLGA